VFTCNLNHSHRYITCTEYTNFYGGKRAEIPRANFKRLPFDHCSLSLQPFEYPVCTEDGVVFELLSIVPWIKKYGTNPISGEVRKYFICGKYHCPVLYNVFTNNSHIVANKVTGNVFSYEAVEQLNIKTKSFKDLLTDEPFTRKDIITLQDPTNLDKFNVSNFFHVKNNLKMSDADEEKARQDPAYHLKTTNLETRETLAELYKDYKGDQLLASTMKEPEAKKTDKINAAHYSTGRVSASFTSTAMTPATTHEADAIADDTVRYQYVKKKGYVRLHTNVGDLNLELHCDKVPKAGENFIRLCKKGYYDGTIFHRSIRNFMVRIKPKLDVVGGESFWGKPFKDEFRPNLSHTGRGVLSMANSGPNTNKSQFFITFRSCTYLDRKHSVPVGGSTSPVLNLVLRLWSSARSSNSSCKNKRAKSAWTIDKASAALRASMLSASVNTGRTRDVSIFLSRKGTLRTLKLRFCPSTRRHPKWRKRRSSLWPEFLKRSVFV
uniref:RING-type E3 ubiquitin transferase n=1 Tax=Nothobranchius furzeri TaxID=105023 RepID=A0A8C6NV52_NOTFU